MTFVPATNGASTGGADTVNVPVTSGGSTGGADTTFTPTTNGGATGGADTSFTPVTDGGSTGGASTSFVPTTGGSSTGGADTTTSSSVVTPSPTIVSGSVSGSTSGGRATILSLSINNGVCTYLNDYLKFGDKTNSSSEITKLQTFLMNVEKMNVDINGNFDSKTFDAVKAFQVNYSNDILAPWGTKNPTGNVSFTTKKKINEISCGQSVALTAEQLSQINSYKNGIITTPIQTIVNGNNSTSTEVTPSSVTPSTITPSITPVVGSVDNGNTQTAAVANTGVFTKVGHFFKWLFGY